jgi:hypothetical protein
MALTLIRVATPLRGFSLNFQISWPCSRFLLAQIEQRPSSARTFADSLERLHGELDAAIELVRSKPDLAAKQPHSRAAMKLLNRIDELDKESNDLLLERDPTSLAHYVTGPLVGSTFRELLAAIYGRDVEIDGVRMFPDYHLEQRAAK